MWLELLTNPTILLPVLAGTLLYLYVKKSKRNLPPGPRGLPIFGNLFNVKQDTMLEDIRKLRQQYGDVFSLSLGSMNMIIINGYDNLKEVFVKRGDEFSRRPNTLHFSCCEYSEKNLLYALADLFVAGTETTSTAITWAIAFLINYPDIQDQIHKELDIVVGSSRPPSLDDRNSLPYFEAFTTEVLRCGNIVSLSLQHSNGHDTTINGFFIPAGSALSPNLDSVLHDPELFPESTKFDPNRFLDEEGRFISSELIIPFGIGRRVCPGEVLARSEFFLFMTSILQRFVLHPVDKANPPSLEGKFAIARAPLPYEYIAVRRT